MYRVCNCLSVCLPNPAISFHLFQSDHPVFEHCGGAFSERGSAGEESAAAPAGLGFLPGRLSRLWQAPPWPRPRPRSTPLPPPWQICRVAVLFLFHVASADTAAPSTPSISCDIKRMNHTCLVLFPGLPHPCKSRPPALGAPDKSRDPWALLPEGRAAEDAAELGLPRAG